MPIRKFLLIVFLIFLYATKVQAFLTDTNSHAPASSGTYKYSPYGVTPVWDFCVAGTGAWPAEGGTYSDGTFDGGGHTPVIRRLSDSYGQQGLSQIRHVLYGGLHLMSPDNNYVLLNDDVTYWYIYNVPSGGMQTGLTHNPLQNLHPDGGMVQWHPTNSHWIAFFTGGNYEVLDMTIDTIVSAQTVTFGSGLNNGGEGDFISTDGRYIVGWISANSGTLRVYDTVNHIFYSNQPTGVNWSTGGVYMAPDGSGVIVSSDSPYSQFFPLNHSTQAFGSPIHLDNKQAHSAVVTDTSGKTWYVVAGASITEVGGQAIPGYSGGVPGIIFIDVLDPANWATGHSWILDMGAQGWEDKDVSGYMGGVNADWSVISSWDHSDWNTATPWTPWEVWKEEIFMINARTKELRRIAHHRGRNVQDSHYDQQTEAQPSFDGTLILFNSNGGRGDLTNYCDAYTVTTGLSGGGGNTYNYSIALSGVGSEVNNALESIHSALTLSSLALQTSDQGAMRFPSCQ